VVLLEVLLSLALFISAATVLGMAVRASTGAAARVRDETMAANLAETVLAELAIADELVDIPPTEFLTEGEAVEGEPVNVAEGWTKEVVVADVPDSPGLKRVTVIIRGGEPTRPTVLRLTQWMIDPAGEAGGEYEEFGGL
jgi:hypothetical protein